jgi:manganese oxidase
MTRISLQAAGLVALLASAPIEIRRAPSSGTRAESRIVINDNRAPGGDFRGGVLTIRLEARAGEWHPDGESDPGLTVLAFGEEGKSLQIPAPLIRVPKGTEIHAFVRNSTDSTLVVHGLYSRGTSGSGADTIPIKPGTVSDVRFVAGTPGTYYYWATTAGSGLVLRPGVSSQLSGAFIVDSAAVPSGTRDRVFVIGLWQRTPAPGGLLNRFSTLRFAINGKAWPNTERLSYTEGDSIRFRIVNASSAVHPMHLHGFYFNVDSRGDERTDSTYDRAAAPHLVVTERVAAGRTFSMTWVPERRGNWLFHCHDNFHVLRNPPLDGSRLPAEQTLHPENHTREMMGGLVMGVEVRPNPRLAAATEPAARRRLRLLARVDSGGTEDDPAYGYVLQDGARSIPASAPLLPGPTIVLKRGEPVSITVVNELPEATAVHWHGIELDSYYDGVAGFAGHPNRIAPAIAPKDSFEARFTPPRSGTFMYHPHADEVRQQQAGLTGVLLVVDSAEAYDPEHDLNILLTVPRLTTDRGVTLINGSIKPPLREMRVGERYRMRLVNVHTFRPSMVVRLLQDSTLLTWRALAKDGMQLPGNQATVRPSVQQMGNGETYDYEFVPTAPGDLQLTVRAAAGALLARMPIRVR